MPTTATSIDVNVSLEPHLSELLKNIRALLPEDLAADLAAYIDAEPPKEIIPYRLLQAVSQWSRSNAGAEILRSKSMNPGTLAMVSLLAGTTTSPDRKFGSYVREKEPEEIALNKARERKAITALVNALFSVFGAGFAAWWGADKTGWRDEHKVLFAIFVGIVVAASEALLYVIWTSKKVYGKQKRKQGLDKKRDGGSNDYPTADETTAIATSSKDTGGSGLRQRRDPKLR